MSGAAGGREEEGRAWARSRDSSPLITVMAAATCQALPVCFTQRKLLGTLIITLWAGHLVPIWKMRKLSRVLVSCCRSTTSLWQSWNQIKVLIFELGSIWLPSLCSFYHVGQAKVAWCAQDWLEWMSLTYTERGGGRYEANNGWSQDLTLSGSGLKHCPVRVDKGQTGWALLGCLLWG